MSDEVVYAEWDDGRGNLVRLVSQVFQNKRVLHLRRYWQPGGPGSDWKPTRFGVVMTEENARELDRGLAQAREHLEW